MKKSRKTLKRTNQNVSVDQVISNRILILTLIIVVCFLVIFLRLFYLQIISYNDYTAKREDYTSIKQYTSAPRGQIYDCKGRILAKTVVSHNIVFTSPNNFDEDDVSGRENIAPGKIHPVITMRTAAPVVNQTFFF